MPEGIYAARVDPGEQSGELDGVEYGVIIAMRGVSYSGGLGHVINPLTTGHRRLARRPGGVRRPLARAQVGVHVPRRRLRPLVHEEWTSRLDEALVLAVEICAEVAAGL